MSLTPTPPVAFVYAGPESSVGDTLALVDAHPEFARVLDRCAGAYREVTGANLRGRLAYPDPQWPMDIAQPVLVSLQLALTAVLAEAGISPDHVYGHGVGELAALVTAGAMEVEDAVRLASYRGRLMQEYGEPAGALYVQAERSVVDGLLAHCPDLEVAAVDGPDSHTVAGPEAVVDQAAAWCRETGTRFRRSSSTRAFHTSLAEPVLAELDATFTSIPFRATTLPFTSGVDGTTHEPGWVPDADYLRDQARLPVRFDLALEALLASDVRTLVEVGPVGIRASLDELIDPGTIIAQRDETGRSRARWHGSGNLYYAGVSMEGSPPEETPPAPSTAETTPRIDTVTTTATDTPSSTSTSTDENPITVRLDPAVDAPVPVASHKTLDRHRALMDEQARILTTLEAAAPPKDSPLAVSLWLSGTCNDLYSRVRGLAGFAETYGLHAVWLHGPAAVLAAALAVQTSRVRLHGLYDGGDESRAVAEWSVVNAASNGRAALGFPARDGHDMYPGLAEVRRLWSAPPPMYAVLNGDPESCRRAARLGLHVVADLRTRPIVELAKDLALYRRTREANGLDRDGGRVVVAVPTFDDVDEAATLLTDLRAAGAHEVACLIDLRLSPMETQSVPYVPEPASEPMPQLPVAVEVPPTPEPDPTPAPVEPVEEAEQEAEPEPEPKTEPEPPVEEKAEETEPEPALEPVAAPLSPAQLALWDSVPDALSRSRAIQLDGPLTVSALGSALQAVVDRHDPLRTVFTDVDGVMTQLILPKVDVELPVVDLTGYHEETAVRHALTRANTTPLDQANGQAVSFQLLRFSYTRHVLVCTFHPLTTDPWAYVVMAREVSEIYRASLVDQTADLPELTIGYAALAAEQVAATTDPASLVYWTERFKEPVPALELPADRTRPKTPSSNAHTVSVDMPVSLAERIRTFSVEAQVAVPTTLLAAFAAMLYQHSGRSDVLVGAEIPGREERAEPLFGPFSRLIPMRLDLDGDPTFRELLDRVRDTTATAYEHSSVPWQELRDIVTAGGVPGVEVAIEFDGGILEPTLPGVRTTVLESPPDSMPVDLRLRVWQRDGIRWRLDYRTDVFGEDLVRAYLTSLLDILTVAVEEPDAPLSTLLGLGRELVPALLGSVMPPSSDSLHELFALQVAAAPDAEAVVCGDERWTYRELHERSSVLAEFLQSHGTNAGDLVAVCLPRRPELIAAQLAALQLGAAFLPLDPSRSEETLRSMVIEARARIVLSTRDLSVDAGESIVYVEDAEAGIAALPIVTVDPEDIAYVVFGVRPDEEPRAVAVPHRAIVNTVRWGMTTLGLASGDHVSHQLPLDHDVNLAEIYPALIAGATVHMVPDEVTNDPMELTNWWTEHRVTVACLPMRLAEKVFARPLPDGNRLRFLLVGGGHVGRRPALSFPTVFDMYGTPENAIVTMLSILGQEDESSPSVGLPVDNNRLYVVDRHGGPARPGIPGELWIGGAGVAGGYPGDTTATREAFVPEPDVPGGVIFRTGDQVRVHGDGDLEFCGRLPGRRKRDAIRS